MDSGQATGDLTEEQKRENVVRLAFGGDEAKHRQFCEVICAAIPGGTTVVLRGSAVTGVLAGRTTRRSTRTVRAPAIST